MTATFATDRVVMAAYVIESGIYLPGDGDGVGWRPILSRKLAECSAYFIASICAEGIQRPVLWRPAETWSDDLARWVPSADTRVIRDGHHRLAVAYRYGLSVPLSDIRSGSPDTLPSFHTVGDSAA